MGAPQRRHSDGRGRARRSGDGNHPGRSALCRMKRKIRMDENETTAASDTPAAGDGSIHALIDRWFADHFHGSIVSRDTDTYAHVFTAKERLKQLLADRKE